MNKGYKRLFKAFRSTGAICLYDLKCYYNKNDTIEQRIQSLIRATYSLKEHRKYRNIIRDKYGNYKGKW